MYKLIVIFLLMISSSWADTRKIYSFDVKKFKEANAYIGFKESSDKAYIAVWARVVINHEELYQEYILKPKFLQYSAETHEITMTDENQKKTVCGTVLTRGRGLYRRTFIASTNLCEFFSNSQLEVFVKY
jgi:hypothetical protein